MANHDSQLIALIIGDVIKRRRTIAGLSQEELAFRAGVDRTFVSRLEKGVRQPTITTIIALAEALGTSAVKLVKETEDEYRRVESKQ
jgi:transcriptional regulator with XRE-family HTH domain